MRKLLPMCLLASLALSCGSDPIVDKAHFPTEMATSVCRWYFACCDSAERLNLKVQATTESACITELAAAYATAYQSADAKLWDGKAGQACVDQVDTYSLPKSVSYCKRSFDPATTIAACPMIRSTAMPGDPCSSTWECSTKFCRMGGGVGTCANPLPANAACSGDEPCASGLRCVENKCQALQPDGASCKFGTECISGACGAGQCVNAASYTCDGK